MSKKTLKINDVIELDDTWMLDKNNWRPNGREKGETAYHVRQYFNEKTNKPQPAPNAKDAKNLTRSGKLYAITEFPRGSGSFCAQKLKKDGTVNPNGIKIKFNYQPDFVGYYSNKLFDGGVEKVKVVGALTLGFKKTP